MTEVELPWFLAVWGTIGGILAFYWRDFREQIRNLVSHTSDRIRASNARRGLHQSVDKRDLAKDFLFFGRLGILSEYAVKEGVDPKAYSRELRDSVEFPHKYVFALVTQLLAFLVWIGGLGVFLPVGLLSRFSYLLLLAFLLVAVILSAGLVQA